VDNNRLLRALVISVFFHGLLFFGVNSLDWFPERDNPHQYGTVTVVLEPPSPPKVNTDNLKDQIIEKEIITTTTNEESIPQNSAISTGEDLPANFDINKNTVYDPYADIGKKLDSVILDTSEKQPEGTNQDKVYVPVVKDSIEFEVPVRGASGSQSLNNDTDTKTKNSNTIISPNDISNLEKALSSDNNNDFTSETSESNNNIYQYKDSPVDFDTEGIDRKLVSNPYPELPDDLPVDFPPEITYKIRFSLNTDGLIKVLSISPPPLYPKVELSIRNALRSWTFNQSTGTKDVKGTITLIFKGR